MHGNGRVHIVAAALLGAVLGGGAASAADEPAAIVKYRQATMKAIGGHMAMLAAMAKGEVSFTDEANGHAHAIHQMSQSASRLFPEGTGEGATEVETKALAAIWEKPDEFQQAITALQEESKKLADLTDGGNFEQAAFAQQIGALGKNGCTNCHETFRAEDN